MTEYFDIMLQVCGGIAITGAAFTVIKKWIAPAVKLSKRVSNIEHKQEKDFNTIREVKELNGLLCRGMICLIEHEVTGNGIDKLKEVKTDMQDYLIKRGS